MKLIARIYDTTEGQILVDGVDIKTIRLDDLRHSISALFQDYTLFPLSVRPYQRDEILFVLSLTLRLRTTLD